MPSRLLPWRACFHQMRCCPSAQALTDRHNLLINAIATDALHEPDRASGGRFEGNVLLLSSSLDPKLADLTGFRGGEAVKWLGERLKQRRVELEAAWAAKSGGGGGALEREFGWLATPPPAGLRLPPAANAPLGTQLAYMTSSWKVARCTLPYRHTWERCPHYCVLQLKANLTNQGLSVFDARRPPLRRDGTPAYSSSHCPASRACAGSARTPHWFACAKGAACGQAHSQMEVLYHPELFKLNVCKGSASAGMCDAVAGGVPLHVCAFAHNVEEVRVALQAAMAALPTEFHAELSATAADAEDELPEWPAPASAAAPAPAPPLAYRQQSQSASADGSGGGDPFPTLPSAGGSGGGAGGSGGGAGSRRGSLTAGQEARGAAVQPPPLMSGAASPLVAPSAPLVPAPLSQPMVALSGVGGMGGGGQAASSAQSQLAYANPLLQVFASWESIRLCMHCPFVCG